jgi:hypothetical protein
LRLAAQHGWHPEHCKRKNNRTTPTESHRQPSHNFPSARSQRK